jgi:adenylate cyclase
MVVIAIIGIGVGWWAQRLDIEPVDPAKLAFKLPDKPSIAVLPFDNLSNDPEQEFFSDGITEDLITDLSRVSGLFVIARNTVFTYKGQAQDIQKIGNKLGVKYVLEGSVRRSGENLRINAQLIDVQTGGHVWAQRFDRKLADVFELQDDVVQKIVAALAITLKPVEKERLERVRKAHPEAYIAFLRGLELMRQYSQDTNIEARQYFEKSIAIDPKFTRAYASLAFLHVANVNTHFVDDPAKTTNLALKYAQQALKLDDAVPQIYFALTSIYQNMNRLEDGISAARKAIALDPNYADAYANLALVLNFDGQYSKALQSIDYAMRLNPETPISYRWIKGHTYYLLRQLGKAVFWLEGARDRNPETPIVYQMLIATYVELGRIEDAEWAVEELLTLVPNFSLSQEGERTNYRDKEVRRRYFESLRKAGIE